MTEMQKVHNSTLSSKGLLICLDIDFDKKIEGVLEDSIKKWVYGCLDNAHQALDFDRCWDFIFTVAHEQVDAEDTADTEDTEDTEKMNGVVVAVHFQETECYDWPLFREEGIQVDPSLVLDHFINPPAYVRTVGVSGVSEKCLQTEWTDMISTCPDRYDRPGEGEMMHPMYILPERRQFNGTEVFVIREMSFNFGWKN